MLSTLARARRAVWETIVFLLNGMVFIITGLEVPFLLRSLEPAT